MVRAIVCRFTKPSQARAGNSISFYGRTGTLGGRAMLSLDGGTPATVDFRSSAGPQSPGRSELLFVRDALDPKTQHTLTLAVSGDGEIGVDYFEITGTAV